MCKLTCTTGSSPASIAPRDVGAVEPRAGYTRRGEAARSRHSNLCRWPVRAWPGRVLLAVLVAGGLWVPVRADLATPSLFSQFDPLEKIAARANQTVYNQLDPLCNAGMNAAAGCGPSVFAVYSNVRELVDTANQLTGAGPTTYSLDISAVKLGFALRWTAAEEVSSQSAAAKNFSNAQASTLAARLSALRGEGPLGIARWDGGGRGGAMGAIASVGRGGGASADLAEAPALASRFGVFANDAYQFGSKDDTTYRGGFEDAFRFNGNEASVGFDYRCSNQLVAGIVFSYLDKRVDFNSQRSIVNGHLDTHGGGATFYAQWEGEHDYLTASLGGQSVSNDLLRKITYASLNPSVPSTNETALSSTAGFTVTVSLEAGYNRSFGAFSLEPFVQATYKNVGIRGFQEAGAGGFQFSVGHQAEGPVDGVLGVRLQYVLTPAFGVFIPYFHAEYHREFNSDARIVDSTYSQIQSQASAASNVAFAIPTDKPDLDYFSVVPGVTAVFPHGVQAFLQYQSILGFQYYTINTVSGGIRWNF